MLVVTSFVLLVLAFFVAPVVIVIGGSHIIREDDRLHQS